MLVTEAREATYRPMITWLGTYVPTLPYAIYTVTRQLSPLLSYLQSNDFYKTIQMVVTKSFALPTSLRHVVAPRVKSFSVLHRPSPKYEGHVPLNTFERVTLAAGSAVMSLMNPRRGGMSTVPDSC